MASRKKPIEAMSLFSPKVEAVVEACKPVEGLKEAIEEVLAGAPKLRIVPSPKTPESDVIVEALDDGRFVVSLLRDHGTTIASVRYTRAQLEMLVRRGGAALEVG
jgi:hypothetical protein